MRSDIISILEDTDAESFVSTVRHKLPSICINSLHNMVVQLRKKLVIRSEISRKLQSDIFNFQTGNGHLMACTKPPFVEQSPYENLKPSPDYDFMAGDRVSYYRAYRHSADSELNYAIIQYSPDVASFVLIKYVDDTFTKAVEPTEEVSSMDFLFEVGYNLLKKINQTGGGG